MLRVAIRAGINFIDNAEVYGAYPGESERIMGQASGTPTSAPARDANWCCNNSFDMCSESKGMSATACSLM